MSEQLRNDMREARRSSGLSWAVFARQAGFGEGYLRNVEIGQRAVTIGVATAYDKVLRTGGVFVRALDAAGPRTAAATPWDRDGAALLVLTDLVDGRRVDRRGFIAAGGALAASAGNWAKALNRLGRSPVEAADGGPRLLANIDERLQHLRHVEDELGSGEVGKLARGELSLAVTLLKAGRYRGESGLHLLRIAAEAARQVAWCSFDQGRPGVAQLYFDASLRASSEAEDRIGGTYALSFAAVQLYSTPGQADRAVSLLESARSRLSGAITPRMEAMLAARTARALSKTGAKAATAHHLHLARTALDKGPRDDDPDFLYWVTDGELEMIAGSSALDLGDPSEALRRFEAGMRAQPSVGEEYPRSHAIYLARAAEAHLALDDLDAALAAGQRAAACLGAVDSTRSASQLTGLRGRLELHATYRPVAEFLEATGG